MVGVTLAMIALGLLVSAMIDNADRGMPLLVVSLLDLGALTLLTAGFVAGTAHSLRRLEPRRR